MVKTRQSTSAGKPPSDVGRPPTSGARLSVFKGRLDIASVQNEPANGRRESDSVHRESDNGRRETAKAHRFSDDGCRTVASHHRDVGNLRRRISILGFVTVVVRLAFGGFGDDFLGGVARHFLIVAERLGVDAGTAGQ